jgi:hypothetical protein
MPSLDTGGVSRLPQTRVLAVVSGPAAGRSLRFLDNLLLGRGEPNGGDLGGEVALSNHHAILRCGPDGLTTIEDLGSATGTLVNGIQISGCRPIGVGDTVTVGDSTLRLVALPPPVVATTPSDLPPSRPATGAVKASRGYAEAEGWTPPPPSVMREGLAPPPSGEEVGWVPTESSPQNRDGAVLRPRVPQHEQPLAPGTTRRGGGPWSGTVNSVSSRSEQSGAHTINVLSCRVEQFTERGDRSGVMSVELRRRKITGDVSVGDRVVVHGRIRGGTIRAKLIDNLTTGATVHEVGGGRRRVGMALRVVIVVVFAVAFVAILLVVLMVLRNHPAAQISVR